MKRLQLRLWGLSLEKDLVSVKIRVGGNMERKAYRGGSGRIWEGGREAGAGRAENTETDGDERT